ncbi:SHOCT domain-containing protein [Waltera intestinalis]
MDIIEKKKLLRYSMQLSMLRQLLSMKLINDFEYEKIKKRLMRDYGVVSNITT